MEYIYEEVIARVTSLLLEVLKFFVTISIFREDILKPVLQQEGGLPDLVNEEDALLTERIKETRDEVCVSLSVVSQFDQLPLI